MSFYDNEILITLQKIEKHLESIVNSLKKENSSPPNKGIQRSTIPGSHLPTIAPNTPMPRCKPPWADQDSVERGCPFDEDNFKACDDSHPVGNTD